MHRLLKAFSQKRWPDTIGGDCAVDKENYSVNFNFAFCRIRVADLFSANIKTLFSLMLKMYFIPKILKLQVLDYTEAAKSSINALLICTD